MTDETTWDEKLQAMQALVFAPFIIFIVVIVVSAVLITAAIERSNKS